MRSRAQRRSAVSHRDGDARSTSQQGMTPDAARARALQEFRPHGKAHGRRRATRAASRGSKRSSRTCATACARCCKHPGYAAAGRPHARPRHRRQHRDLQRDQRRAAQAAAVRERRSAGRSCSIAPLAGQPNFGVVDHGAVRLPQAARQLRRPRRVPPDELRSAAIAASPIASPPASSRRTSSTCSASSRSWAARSSRPTMTRARMRCWCSSHAYWQTQVRRRPRHHRPGVRDERPPAHASSACCRSVPHYPQRSRRLHADVGVPVPRRGGEAHRDATAAPFAGLQRVRLLEARRVAASRPRAPRSRPCAQRFTQDYPQVYRPEQSGFQAQHRRTCSSSSPAARARCC